jgi:hypothetical protein
VSAPDGGRARELRATYGVAGADRAGLAGPDPARVAALRERARELGVPLEDDDVLVAWWGELEPPEPLPDAVWSALAELAAFLAGLGGEREQD